jgi:hypothetical protein
MIGSEDAEAGASSNATSATTASARNRIELFKLNMFPLLRNNG